VQLLGYADKMLHSENSNVYVDGKHYTIKFEHYHTTYKVYIT